MSSLICGTKTNKLIDNTNWWLSEVGRVRETKIGEGGQKVKIFSYKRKRSRDINKYISLCCTPEI